MWNMIALDQNVSHTLLNVSKAVLRSKWTHHSLSRLLHGLRPVTISRMQQPVDQISEAPNLPDFSFLITSGAMYIGVPANEFIAAGPSAPAPAPVALVFRFATRVFAIVLLPFAITLAAPKSTNLIVEFVPSKMSAGRSELGCAKGRRRCYDPERTLTVRLDVSVLDTSSM